MHMASTLIAPAVAATMYTASGGCLTYSIKKVRLEQDNSKIPLMGVMGALVFATQMINFNIPGTGSSGHLLGGFLLTALLGPHAGFLTMAGILTIQSVLFADGGLLALGCNIWNMAFYSCFLGYYCIYRPFMSKGKCSRKRIVVVSILGSILSLQLGAFSVTIETLVSGVAKLPFPDFFMAMQPIHLIIGTIEGLVTAAILLYLYEARPEMLTLSEKTEFNMTYKKILTILALLAVLAGGGMSLMSSTNPDGLEWSIQNVTGQTEIENAGYLYQSEAALQEKIALLPDYSITANENKMLGTSISGVIGSLAICGTLIIMCRFLQLFKR